MQILHTLMVPLPTLRLRSINMLPPLAQLLVCGTLQTCASNCTHRQTCTPSDMQILHSLLVLVLLLLLLLLSGSPESDIATVFEDCRYDSVYFLISISCSDIVYVLALIADLCGLRQVHLHAAQLSWTPCPGTQKSIRGLHWPRWNLVRF
jgi:hypothetical protein